MEKKSVFLRIVIGYACISSLGVTGYLGFYRGEWFLVLCVIEVLLHVALLAVGIWLAVRALRKEPPRKKGVRAGMLAGGLAILYFLTCFGGVQSFKTDEGAPAVLAEVREAFTDYCEAEDFSGVGGIYDNIRAEHRTARAWRLPEDEAAARKLYRHLSGDFWMGYGALVTKVPFLQKRIDLPEGYALCSPVVAMRVGTVPEAGEYLGFVFLHGPGGNFCVEFTFSSAFPLRLLFCAGVKGRELTRLCEGILADPGSFYRTPANDPALQRFRF